MGWLQPFIDIIQFFWPFRIVHSWEVAGWYVLGKYKGRTGPGLKMLVPWFIEVREVSMARAIVKTPRNDITLKDGSVLHYSASATCRVVDYDLAVNSVDEYQETTQERLEAVLGDKLAEVERSRLEPNGRKRLLSDLQRWVNERTMEFGIETSEVSFTTFVLNPRTFRVLGNQDWAKSW